eukprot:scaffold80824_cov15-Tisochrysis_lutea.AAC.1
MHTALFANISTLGTVLTVFTPQFEHFGIVPLEAMAAKKLVIAVNNGGGVCCGLHQTCECRFPVMLYYMRKGKKGKDCKCLYHVPLSCYASRPDLLLGHLGWKMRTEASLYNDGLQKELFNYKSYLTGAIGMHQERTAAGSGMSPCFRPLLVSMTHGLYNILVRLRLWRMRKWACCVNPHQQHLPLPSSGFCVPVKMEEAWMRGKWGRLQKSACRHSFHEQLLAANCRPTWKQQ